MAMALLEEVYTNDERAEPKAKSPQGNPITTAGMRMRMRIFAGRAGPRRDETSQAKAMPADIFSNHDC